MYCCGLRMLGASLRTFISCSNLSLVIGANQGTRGSAEGAYAAVGAGVVGIVVEGIGEAGVAVIGAATVVDGAVVLRFAGGGNGAGGGGDIFGGIVNTCSTAADAIVNWSPREHQIHSTHLERKSHSTCMRPLIRCAAN